MKKQPKRYEIDTLDKLINTASLDNMDRLTVDFLLWLHYTLSAIDALKKNDPEGTKGKSNTQIMKSIFIWIDDGKNELKQFEIKNPSTGEVRIVKVKK